MRQQPEVRKSPKPDIEFRRPARVYEPVTMEDLDDETIADDLLIGGYAIARFWHGTATKKNRRKIYNARIKSRLPIVKVGGRLVARKSQLRAEIARREQAAREGK
jgi:hypothetical protein